MEVRIPNEMKILIAATLMFVWMYYLLNEAIIYDPDLAKTPSLKIPNAKQIRTNLQTRIKKTQQRLSQLRNRLYLGRIIGDEVQILTDHPYSAGEKFNMFGGEGTSYLAKVRSTVRFYFLKNCKREVSISRERWARSISKLRYLVKFKLPEKLRNLKNGDVWLSSQEISALDPQKMDQARNSMLPFYKSCQL